MDFIDGENIENYLIWSPEEINNIFSQTIEAFTYLEKYNILHRDIRPKNILITKEKTVKIIDFGFGKQILSSEDFDKSISLNWLYEKPDDFNHSIYDFKTEIYFIGKLFETLIYNYNISGFKYTDILRKMVIKSHDERIGSFDQVKDYILNNSYIFDEYFNYLEKQKFQDFMDKIIPVFGEISTDANYFNNIDQLVIELEDVFKNNSLDNDVQNNTDILRAFVKGNYTFYSSRKVDVESLKSFIQLIKTSNTEKRNMIKLGIVNRLRVVERMKKEDDSFVDDIPF
jgi:serine/threonine-protein kinase